QLLEQDVEGHHLGERSGMTKTVGIAREEDIARPRVNCECRELDLGRRQIDASCAYGENQQQADHHAAKGSQRHLQLPLRRGESAPFNYSYATRRWKSELIFLRSVFSF